ncbi:MAG: AAA family ATPase [Gemmataceae bacterium]
MSTSPPPLCSLSAADLLKQQLPPVRWVIPGLLPDGGFLLAGRPRIGKSALALQAALGVVTGKPVWGALAADAGEALYLALEDGERSLQSRLRCLVAGLRVAGLHLAFDAPTPSARLVDALDGWLDDHPKAKMVVIDTLDRLSPRGGPVNEDVTRPLSQLGQRRGVAVVIVHHLRKRRETEADPFDALARPADPSAGVDTTAVLRRSPGAAEARLFVSGRDVDDQALRLVCEEPVGLWRLLRGEELPPEQGRVVKLLTGCGAMTPLQVAGALGKSHGAVKMLLHRMSAEGRIVSERGKYSLPPPVPMLPELPGR